MGYIQIIVPPTLHGWAKTCAIRAGLPLKDWALNRILKAVIAEMETNQADALSEAREMLEGREE